MPSDMMTPRKSSPAWVSLYSTAPGWAAGVTAMTPACSSSLRRFDRSAGDMRGTPRLRSLKRVEPYNSSRKSSAVQREQTISAAMATGQNCP